MERRTLLQIAAAAVCGPQASTELRFFTAAEMALLDQLMELIIPADDHSPGAKAAGTSRFADFMVANGSAALQKQWREGLQEVAARAAKSSAAEALEEAAKNERHPASKLEYFFTQLKTMTVQAYYTSPVGIQQEMEYKGNAYLLAFPGCEHPEHK
jgi:hypothetical protein